MLCEGKEKVWRGWRHVMRLRRRVLRCAVWGVIASRSMVGQPLPPFLQRIRTFPLFLGILSSSCGCLWLLLGGVVGVVGEKRVHWARSLCSGGPSFLLWSLWVGL
jgi:hypothetical protein